MDESNISPYGISKEYSVDKHGIRVIPGSQIRVLALDEEIIRFLPEDEVQELKSFIDGVFTILHVNSDGSVLVEKEWREGDVIMGHGLAVFPGQFETYVNDT